MSDAIACFCLRLLAGIATSLCVIPQRAIPGAFFRILLLVCLGLAAVAALTSAGGPIGPIGLGVLAYLGSILWLLERRSPATVCLALVAVGGVVESLRSAERLVATLPADRAATYAATLASLATLGTAMSGMLLGHRYLTAPGMPLAPLHRMNNGLGLAAVARGMVSGWMLAAHPLPSLAGGPAIWLALRWGAGVCGLLVAWFLVIRILRYRNTQSATGVLFVAVILSFLGELTGDLLLRTLRVPY